MRKLLELALCVLSIVSPAFAETDPIKLGAIFSLSSWGAEGGTGELHGAMLAVEEINRSGGIRGRPIELIVEDNRSDLKTSASAFMKLSAVDQVPAIVGPNWMEFIDVVAPLAVKHRVPVVTPSGYHERHLKDDPWVFVLWPPPLVATRILADRIVRDGRKRVTAFVSDNTYYQGVWRALENQLAAAGVKVDEAISFPPGTTDFRSALTRVSRSATEALLPLLVESGDFATFLRQRLALKNTLPLYGANTLPFDKTVQGELGLAEGLIYFDYVTAGGSDFARKYRERFAAEPGFGSAKAYDGVFIIADAARTCGLGRQQVRSCLRAVDYKGASGPIRFTKTGVIEDATPNTSLLVVRDGKIESLR